MPKDYGNIVLYIFERRILVLTPEEFKNAMALIDEEHRRDPETAHRMMDELMAATLSCLGYKDGVDIFNGSMKWYA